MRCLVILSLLLSGFLSLSAQNSTETVADRDLELTEELEESNLESQQIVKRGLSDDLDFADRYYPFTLDENLDPELEASMVSIWILSLNIKTRRCTLKKILKYQNL